MDRLGLAIWTITAIRVTLTLAIFVTHFVQLRALWQTKTSNGRSLFFFTSIAVAAIVQFALYIATFVNDDEKGDPWANPFRPAGLDDVLNGVQLSVQVLCTSAVAYLTVYYVYGRWTVSVSVVCATIGAVGLLCRFAIMAYIASASCPQHDYDSLRCAAAAIAAAITFLLLAAAAGVGLVFGLGHQIWLIFGADNVTRLDLSSFELAVQAVLYISAVCVWIGPRAFPNVVGNGLIGLACGIVAAVYGFRLMPRQPRHVGNLDERVPLAQAKSWPRSNQSLK